MFQMLGVFAEFERAIIVERVNAGLARARAGGTKSGRAIGRPAVADKAAQAARNALAAGSTIRQAAQMAGLSVGKVGQLKLEIARLEMNGAD
jgi:DNA invertase Pin-like site-specific DNA recombinase